MYYYGARYYAAWTCRFISVDPLAAEYPFYTPYNYAGNKPINKIDIDGMQEDGGSPQAAPTGGSTPNEKNNASTAPTIYEINKDKAGTSTVLKDGTQVTYVNDKYEAAILKGDYTYTKNYGWVDAKHAFTPSKRDNIGANNLWNQIANETGEKKDGGFKVTYIQDASVFGMKSGVEKSYWVQSGLGVNDKRGIAMKIMQDVSFDFEKKQALAVWSGSSFEPSDLTSNLLGLYDAMFDNLNKDKIMNLIEPLSREQSLEVYKQYPGTFTDEKYKNHIFSPREFPNKYSPKGINVPNELKSVKPASMGSNFKYW